MIKLILFSLFSFIQLIRSTEVIGGSCTSECLTKSYCLSIDGSTGCSDNNLIKVTINGGYSESNANGFNDVESINLTIIGYNVLSTIPWKIQFQLINNTLGSTTTYLCDKDSTGTLTRAIVDHGTGQMVTGISSYSNGVLYCTWIFNRNDQSWPQYQNQSINLITDKSYSLSLGYGANRIKMVQVASDTSDLPIYQIKYLKCCNNLHGNDNYQLIYKQSNQSTDFLIATIDAASVINQMTVKLNASDDKQLSFECNLLPKESLTANFMVKGNSENINSQLISQSIGYSTCSWSQPLVIHSASGDLDIKGGAYDLQIESNGGIVYTEKQISFDVKSNGSSVIASLIITIFSILFSISIS